MERSVRVSMPKFMQGVSAKSKSRVPFCFSCNSAHGFDEDASGDPCGCQLLPWGTRLHEPPSVPAASCLLQPVWVEFSAIVHKRLCSGISCCGVPGLAHVAFGEPAEVEFCHSFAHWHLQSPRALAADLLRDTSVLYVDFVLSDLCDEWGS